MASRVSSGSTPERGRDETDSQESCRACLITGVSTCVGLSGYFLYLATEEEEGKTETGKRERTQNGKGMRAINGNKGTPKAPPSSSLFGDVPKFMRGTPAPPQHRPFLFAMSAAWAVAGAYRLYLG